MRALANPHELLHIRLVSLKAPLQGLQCLLSLVIHRLEERVDTSCLAQIVAFELRVHALLAQRRALAQHVVARLRRVILRRVLLSRDLQIGIAL